MYSQEFWQLFLRSSKSASLLNATLTIHSWLRMERMEWSRSQWCIFHGSHPSHSHTQQNNKIQNAFLPKLDECVCVTVFSFRARLCCAQQARREQKEVHHHIQFLIEYVNPSSPPWIRVLFVSYPNIIRLERISCHLEQRIEERLKIFLRKCWSRSVSWAGRRTSWQEDRRWNSCKAANAGNSAMSNGTRTRFEVCLDTP